MSILLEILALRKPHVLWRALRALATYSLSYNINHHYGSPYIDIDFGTFYCNNGDGIRDHLSMQMQRTASLNILPTGVSEIHELVHFYFLGMQSNNLKAKFFNLFLIIEAIEGSVIARSMFSDGTLFTEEEKKLIRETANEMENDRKKSIVQSILSRTDQSRHNKLHSTLMNLGITHFYVLDSTKTPISIEAIKSLIEARNKLFHKGNAVNEPLMWGQLIPLTREIVKHLLSNPFALDPTVASSI
ncbi:hypothetical protein [Pseudomonas sp. LB3P25]